MKKNLLTAVLVGCFANMVYAENNSQGLYFGGRMGNSYLTAKEITSTINETENITTNINAGETDDVTSARAVYLGYDYNVVYYIPLRIELAYTVNDNLNKQTNIVAITNAESVVLDTYHNIKTGMKTVMLNGYFDLYTNSNYTPYINAGIGLALSDFKTNVGIISNSETIESYETSKTNLTFAWSVGIGLAYNLNPNWLVDLNASYVNASKVSNSGVYGYASNTNKGNIKTSAKLNSVNTMVSIRYTF